MEVNIKTIKVSAYIVDCFGIGIKDSDGVEIVQYNGYVPAFFPGVEACGDQVDWEIDVETGQILNWKIDEMAFEDWINDIRGEL